MQLLFDAFDDEIKTKTDNDALDVDAGSEDDSSQMEDNSDVQKNADSYAEGTSSQDLFAETTQRNNNSMISASAILAAHSIVDTCLRHCCKSWHS